MEDRYDIRGKIGQGGLGAVYRGYDLKMKREVAIKRILTHPEDPSLQEEATKQLAAEAGSLASLQHPHIVTVYDVGHDEDGPYVVMELISGKTLDEILEDAPLTWPDFREMAMQTQEALIAAQELNMIHSDLKPPNIMLTWLPSGKFQVKIVDFGLAMLAQNQSKEEIEEMETVFGSIFFMPPEQFEREILDARSDLYSIGCVYYQCLTGTYPFNGETGNEVMESHLNHTVTPLQEVRADIPLWACDWVMWHLNRNREDRPQSARDSLAVFLQNDRNPNPEMSTGKPAGAKPKLIIPGAVPAGPSGDTSAIKGVPLRPPGNTTGLHAVVRSEEEELRKSETSPQPLAPPQGFKPSVHSSPQAKTGPQLGSTTKVAPIKGSTTRIAPTKTSLSPATGSQATQADAEDEGSQVYISPLMQQSQKKGMSAAVKIMLGVVLGVCVVIMAMVLISRSKQNKINERISEIMTEATKDGGTEVAVSRADVEMLLNEVSYTGVSEERELLYEALKMIKSSDGTDIDTMIVNFATRDELLAEVRTTLIGDVLRIRANPDIVPLLMDYAVNTSNMDAAVASFRAIRNLTNDSHTDAFLEVITGKANPTLKREAEANLASIIDASSMRGRVADRVIRAYDKASDSTSRHAMIRLLGRCSTDGSLAKIKEALKSDDDNTRIAATVALSEWKDDRAVAVLLEYLGSLSEAGPRLKVFDALARVASQPFIVENSAKAQEVWTRIRSEAKTSNEKKKYISAIVIIDDTWPLAIVKSYTTDSDPGVVSLAQRGVTHIQDREALKKKPEGQQ